jgi:probable HAF family extracellular repeat protein
MTDLGGASSEARGINASGQVVGWSVKTTYGNQFAFLYSNGMLTDLNQLIDPTSGLYLSEARAINDSGQIVGYGQGPAGEIAFILTPVPEPATMALLALGGLAMLRRRE